MKNNNPIVRDYHDADFPEVIQLWIDTGMADAARGDNQETIRDTIALGGRLFVLEDPVTGKVIGTSWLTQDGRRIYLHHFGVLPTHQQKGYSGLLLKASLDHARSSGLQIKLEVHTTNSIAEKLYRKAGFQYLGDYNVFIIRNYKSIE